MAASWIILLCNLQNRESNFAIIWIKKLSAVPILAIHKNNRKKGLKLAKFKSYSPAVTVVLSY